MSIIVKISDVAFWECAEGIYDSILKRIADAVHTYFRDKTLADALLHNRIGVNAGYYDICTLNCKKFNLLLAAVSCAYIDTVFAWMEAFGEREPYPNHIGQMEKLLDLLHADPRAGRMTC
jgi:hypothetical protein